MKKLFALLPLAFLFSCSLINAGEGEMPELRLEAEITQNGETLYEGVMEEGEQAEIEIREEAFTLSLSPSPAGYNGRAFGIYYESLPWAYEEGSFLLNKEGESDGIYLITPVASSFSLMIGEENSSLCASFLFKVIG